VSNILIGIDTGGTFTDVVLFDGERTITHKLPSTPPDFESAVLQGCAEALQKAGFERGQDFALVHSTTVGTNALLERNGAVTALITTAGFRDVLAIGRQTRPELYNLSVTRPEPLVPRSLRFELAERVNARGDVLLPLADADIEACLDQLAAAGVESLAVCLLFSFLHPEHEARIAAAARARGLPVSVSHEILPEFREFERSSTTVANAFVAPVMSAYLTKLDARSGGARASSTAHGSSQRDLHIVQSNGGSFSAAEAMARPVNTLLSGPAAGVIGALAVARQALDRNDVKLITFDMGGTSTDVSLLNGGAGVSTELDLGGVPVRVPMMDIHTVGAGGGSLAFVDPAAGLHVGPHSAGARPGPACYGVGGERATVTDANAVLGRLDPDHFLDGRMTLNLERAERALAPIAAALDGSIEDAARGILRLANAAMEQAIRVISVERGFDPRTFTLVSFGGAGGLHACALAAALDIPEVLIPRHPGVLSALGCVSADRVRDRSRTLMLPLGSEAHEDFTTMLAVQSELIGEARTALSEEGFSIGRQQFTATLDARYRGQSFEISSPLETTLPSTLAAFHATHERRYGYQQLDAVVEVVALRLRAVGITDKPLLPPWPTAAPSAAPPVPTASGTFVRAELPARFEFDGPARVVEAFSTLHIPDGFSARVDAFGNLRISAKR